ncbi:ParB/RepB/Spo0J family partition protein [Sulfuriflexus mobilis]|uniref:ParB/RepB/Spo0J family partition protein n=1 Tax=Sulfuriflexus mobilis TaxID=1811807 RepID=UPI000F820A30|nr:ParB/RepB/Spo0J family partition protein [Sulfuriflexus mobilis]
MATKKRGLGRGLDALLGGAAISATNEPAGKNNDLRELPIDLMQRGKYQPRVDMHNESLQELADSIRAQGVVQPIVVRPIGGGKYEIIAGERRWRASQLAGLHNIPAVIRDVSDSAAIAMALIENIQREDLNPLEEAHALQRLINEFEMTHQQAAEAVGRSRAAVSNLLRLQELNEGVQRMLEKGDLEMGHGRALLGLRGNAQTTAAQQVVKRGLSVRETEQLVRRESEQSKRAKPAATTHLDPDIRRFQDELSAKLGAKVQIQHTAKGKGKLSIQYNSLDELDGILGHIK